MADQHKGPTTLMTLPLEIHHMIFQHAATGHVQPKKVLRYWFEKKEVKELVAQNIVINPNGPPPRVLESYDGDDMVEDSDVIDVEDDDEDEDGDYDDGDGDGDDDDEDEDSDQEHDGEHEYEEEEENMDDDLEDEALDQENDEGDALPPAPVIRAHGKWRHIPKFMQVTHCPPPVELLLASKQFNNEATNWYYDVVVLRIDATGSFAHTSFFEEAFSQITKAAYSPVENIRKAEVMFVWDTTWIRADETGRVEAIFPALLRQRATFVHQILLQAPDLKELVIYWHDSAQDDESANLRLDVLGPFFDLPASIHIKENYIAADAKPYKKSIAGKRRVEFQDIIDTGLEQLF